MRKIISLLLSIILILSLCACKKNSTQPASDATIYSVGLQENGYYIDYDNTAHQYTHNLEVKEQDLKDFITKLLQEDQQNTNLTYDHYVEMFVNNFLASSGWDKKDIVEKTDVVSASLQFVNSNGENMPEYQNTARYIAQDNGDAIVSSFIGHKVGDQYSVEYTFPENDEHHPSETVTVNIAIIECSYADPINSGVVENHLQEINEILVGVEDVPTLKKALHPYILAYHLQDYIEDVLILQDTPVPSEWVEYERHRLNSRLNALGLTYEQYLSSAQLTEEDVTTMCERNARENMIALSVYSQKFDPITDEELVVAYGEENLAYYESLQGRPYLKLRLMRTRAFFELAKTTNVIDAEGNVLDLSIFFGEETSEGETATEQNSTN